MPLAEIDKMLELIKKAIKTPGGFSLKTALRHISSRLCTRVYPAGKLAKANVEYTCDLFCIIKLQRLQQNNLYSVHTHLPVRFLPHLKNNDGIQSWGKEKNPNGMASFLKAELQ